MHIPQELSSLCEFGAKKVGHCGKQDECSRLELGEEVREIAKLLHGGRARVQAAHCLLQTGEDGGEARLGCLNFLVIRQDGVEASNSLETRRLSALISRPLSVGKDGSLSLR